MKRSLHAFGRRQIRQTSLLLKGRRGASEATRSGSTLLIVVALMGMMMFLGFVFYTFASQERTNATNAAQGAKAQTVAAAAAEPDDLFDFVLQTVILGPNDFNFQSVLWGGRHSLLANMYGRDGIPFNGEGVNLVSIGGQPTVDMDCDGNGSFITSNGLSIAENQNLLNVVDSPVANLGAWNNAMWGTAKNIFLGAAVSGPFNPATPYVPTPDVNYNSPDINSMFLSYDGIASDAAGTTQSRVIIPSYLRPQYLRTGGAAYSSYYTSTNPWYNSAPANQIMRPHPNHYCVDSAGNVLTVGGAAVPRYVSLSDAQSYSSLGLRRPFTSFNYSPETAAGIAASGNLGIWSGVGQNFQFDMSADVDTDGDGIMDAILMDLGYPPIRRGDNKYVIPLFAISIRELNGLLNVNATGNLAGNLNVNTINVNNQLGFKATGMTGVTTPPGSPYVADNLSKSDQGLTTNEINLQRALTAIPADVLSNNPEIAQQLAYFLYQFDTTVNTTNSPQPGRSTPELANLEWLMLNIGRAQFSLGLASTANPIQNAITNIVPGRNGEPVNNPNPIYPNSLLNFLSTFGTNGTLYMPRAGQSISSYTTFPPGSPDDNNNYIEGESNYATRWVNPLDLRGAGIRFRRMGFGTDGQPGKAGVDDDGNGVIDDYIEAGWPGSDDPQSFSAPVKNPMMSYPMGALLWPAYSGFHTSGTVQWGEPASTSYSSQLIRNPIWYSQLDDPTEAVFDPVLMAPSYSASLTTVSGQTGGANPSLASVSNSISFDSVFGPQEMLFLQGSSLDNRQTDSQSRLAELMPGNLVGSSSAADIRKRLTTVSTDRREFGFGINPVGQLRAEAAGSATQYAPWESTPQFPPDALYAGAPNPYRNELFYYLSQSLATSSLKLNVNRLLYLNSNSTQYGFAPLPQQTAVSDVNATIARQNMARDIYTLLYTLCQGQDADYRTTTAATAPTAAQAKEMAQFAVNLVDALDTDNIITAFYYDNDLTQTGVLGAGGGWTAAAATNVVYGVERQLLTFSEAMAFRVGPAAAPPTNDNPMTIFDDKTSGVDGRRYVYFELQNVTPLNVTLASSGVTAANATTNGDWRVRLQDTSGNDLNILYFLNGLDFAHNNVNIDGSSNAYLTAGQTFTVSSQDGSDQFVDGSSGTYRTSDFRMSSTVPGNTATNTYSVYAPAARYTGAVDAGVATPLKGTAGANYPRPNCNLDLVWDGYGGVALPSSRFYLSSNNGTAGAFASPVTKAVGSVQFVLERRAADGSATGVWAAVDKTTTLVVNTISPSDNSMQQASDLPNAITNLLSYPRSAPLLRTTETSGVNTLNTAPSTTGTLWQWQPDRDFASLGELLLLPLYGPDVLTNGRITNGEFYQDTISSTYYPTLASARFLRPDNPDLTLSGTTPNNGNRWYRLLDLLEVQNRGHQHSAIMGIPTTSAITWGAAGAFGTPATFSIAPLIGSTASTSTPLNPNDGLDNFPLMEPYNLAQFFGWPRTHGLLNLNMIRDPQVLAALVDDDTLINDPRFVGYLDTRNANATATSSLYAADDATGSRKWWVEFLKSRESRASLGYAVDPVTGLYVPGTASARPFRSFDSLAVTPLNTTDSPLENTILRSLPLDHAVSPNPNEARRLLEVGLNGSEHFGQVATEVTSSPLHPSTRYQVLSKLMNNTTTRSNSFAVYLTVQYYEAAEVATDTGVTAYRIGGQLTDMPPNRGFFVIDRAAAVEQMKVLSTNSVNPVSRNGTFSFAPNTDTTGIRANMNGIRWKDLVLFRQTLN